ncbi:43219_t:CDS:2, partial [Gigaspora margarita]
SVYPFVQASAHQNDFRTSHVPVHRSQSRVLKRIDLVVQFCHRLIPILVIDIIPFLILVSVFPQFPSPLITSTSSHSFFQAISSADLMSKVTSQFDS